MKRRAHDVLAALALTVYLGTAAFLDAQEKAFRVAMLPFEAQAGVEPGDAMAITEIVRAALAGVNEFIVIENEAVASIIDETGLDPNNGSSAAILRIMAERLKADYAITGAVSVDEGTIILSVRLIDAASARVIFVHRGTSTEALVHREIRLYAEGIANEVVAMTAGATIDNVLKLMKLDLLDDASRKLDAVRLRNPDDERYAETRENLDALLAERAYQNAVKAVALSKKEASTREEFMSQAREYGNEALFLIPDRPGWGAKREKYLTFMQDSVMSYYAAEDKSRREGLIKKSRDLIKEGNPDGALALIADYVQISGERSIDPRLKAVIDASKAKRAGLFYSAAREARIGRDFRQAERLLNEAVRADNSSARYRKERTRLEAAATGEKAAAEYDKRLNSSAWDPAARPPLQIGAGLDFGILDKPTRQWPLGGILPMVRLEGKLSERVAGSILFERSAFLRAGRVSWTGNLDVGSASVDYWKADAAFLLGFTLAGRRIDMGADLGLTAAYSQFGGSSQAYLISETIEKKGAPSAGMALRARLAYRPYKKITLGFQMERSTSYCPGAGFMSGTAFTIDTGLSF